MLRWRPSCARSTGGGASSALTVAIDVLCTTEAQLSLSPPHAIDSILSMRPKAGVKEYLVRWSPSGRRTWAPLPALLAMPGEMQEMHARFERECTQPTVSVTRGSRGFGLELSCNYVVAMAPDSPCHGKIKLHDVIIAVDGAGYFRAHAARSRPLHLLFTSSALPSPALPSAALPPSTGMLSPP